MEEKTLEEVLETSTEVVTPEPKAGRTFTSEECSKGGKRTVQLYGGWAFVSPEERRKGGRKGGKQTQALHGCPISIETRKKAGQTNVDSGHMERIRTPESQSMGGKTQGDINAKNGHMQLIQKIGSRLGAHVLWHVLRTRPENSRYCFYCDGPRKENDN